MIATVSSPPQPPPPLPPHHASLLAANTIVNNVSNSNTKQSPPISKNIHSSSSTTYMNNVLMNKQPNATMSSTNNTSVNNGNAFYSNSTKSHMNSINNYNNNFSSKFSNKTSNADISSISDDNNNKTSLAKQAGSTIDKPGYFHASHKYNQVIPPQANPVMIIHQNNSVSTNIQNQSQQKSHNKQPSRTTSQSHPNEQSVSNQENNENKYAPRKYGNENRLSSTHSANKLAKTNSHDIITNIYEIEANNANECDGVNDVNNELKYMKGYVNVLKERFTRKSLQSNQINHHTNSFNQTIELTSLSNTSSLPHVSDISNNSVSVNSNNKASHQPQLSSLSPQQEMNNNYQRRRSSSSSSSNVKQQNQSSTTPSASSTSQQETLNVATNDDNKTSTTNSSAKFVTTKKSSPSAVIVSSISTEDLRNEKSINFTPSPSNKLNNTISKSYASNKTPTNTTTPTANTTTSTPVSSLAVNPPPILKSKPQNNYRSSAINYMPPSSSTSSFSLNLTNSSNLKRNSYSNSVDHLLSLPTNHHQLNASDIDNKYAASNGVNAKISTSNSTVNLSSPQTVVKCTYLNEINKDELPKPNFVSSVKNLFEKQLFNNNNSNINNIHHHHHHQVNHINNSKFINHSTNSLNRQHNNSQKINSTPTSTSSSSSQSSMSIDKSIVNIPLHQTPQTKTFTMSNHSVAVHDDASSFNSLPIIQTEKPSIPASSPLEDKQVVEKTKTILDFKSSNNNQTSSNSILDCLKQNGTLVYEHQTNSSNMTKNNESFNSTTTSAILNSASTFAASTSFNTTRSNSNNLTNNELSESHKKPIDQVDTMSSTVSVNGEANVNEDNEDIMDKMFMMSADQILSSAQEQQAQKSKLKSKSAVKMKTFYGGEEINDLKSIQPPPPSSSSKANSPNKQKLTKQSSQQSSDYYNNIEFEGAGIVLEHKSILVVNSNSAGSSNVTSYVSSTVTNGVGRPARKKIDANGAKMRVNFTDIAETYEYPSFEFLLKEMGIDPSTDPDYQDTNEDETANHLSVSSTTTTKTEITRTNFSQFMPGRSSSTDSDDEDEELYDDYNESKPSIDYTNSTFSFSANLDSSNGMQQIRSNKQVFILNGSVSSSTDQNGDGASYDAYNNNINEENKTNNSLDSSTNFTKNLNSNFTNFKPSWHNLNYELGGTINKMLDQYKSQMDETNNFMKMNGSQARNNGIKFNDNDYQMVYNNVSNSKSKLTDANSGSNSSSGDSFVSNDILPSKDDEVKRWSCEMDSNILF